MLTINNQTMSQKQAIEYFRHIMYSTEVETPLSERNHLDLLELMLNHPHKDELFSKPIVATTVECNVEYGGYTFAANYADGTKRLFSFMKCLSPTVDWTRRNVIRALTDLVAEEKANFKRWLFTKHKKTAKCGMTSQKLTTKTTSIIYKKPFTFNMIVFEFLNKYGLTFADIELTELGTGRYILTDRDLVSKFLSLHKELAQYYPVHRNIVRKRKRDKIDWNLLNK